jgi:hypothetical protein
VISNILVAIADGVLYQSASGSLASVTGTFNTTATQLQGALVNNKYYIADYRPVNKTGTDGTIANDNQLSDSAVADWTTLSIDTDLDVVYISGTLDTEANIFPITSVTSGYIVFNGTMTAQSGGATWQLGRIPKVWDPANPTTAIANLMTTLPIAPTNYRKGTVTIVNGVATLTDGSWFFNDTATTENMLTLTIPNTSAIGEQQYLVAKKDSNTQVTLVNKTDDADRTVVNYVISWSGSYFGIPPLNCTLCTVYRNRLVLAGPGNLWYMSRILDPDDWDYGYDPNDPSRACSGPATTTVGGIQEPIVALMTHSDAYLIFGCERSLWLATGDPGWCGQLTAISREIGVLGPNAWCNLPDGSIVFMSRDGVYQLQPGASSYPRPISRDLLPAELLNIDSTGNTVSLAYDLEARGIHISITPDAGTTGTHFFMDLVRGGFWPVTMPDTMQPTTFQLFASSATTAAEVVLGGFDGYLRNYDEDATDDDGTDFTAVVTYGPIRAGGPGMEGMLTKLACDLDSTGAGANWGVYPGKTGQAAVVAAVAGATATGAKWNGSLSAGYNVPAYPRTPGGALVIMLSGGEDWAVEGVRTELMPTGTIR